METWLRSAYDALARVSKTREQLQTLCYVDSSLPRREKTTAGTLGLKGEAVHGSLCQISPELANSYAQIKHDIEDDGRISWAGTAHEIREIVARLLRILAPDAEVKAEPWYEQEKGTSGPTHKQRARYVLERQGADSRQTEVAGKVGILDEMIGALVRATYERASDAAHRSKARREVKRILRYFDAFAYDLLNVD